MALTHDTSYPTVLLSVDLFTASHAYMSYIDRWHGFYAHSTHAPFTLRVLHRYEHRWLPLLAASPPHASLEPPPDVHWVWQLHLLLPAHYAAYCNARFGRVLPHRLHGSTRDNVQRTLSLWRSRYPGPEDPYDIDLEALRNSVAVSVNCGGSLDVVLDSARRESDFVYQVSLPHYVDASFLYAAVERYKRLLAFRRGRRDVTLPLPIDVQLVWRVHLLHPLQYAEDTRRVLGSPAYSLGDWDTPPLVDQEKIRRAAPEHPEITEESQAWMKEFSAPLYIEGSGYRGLATLGSLMERFPRENYDVAVVDSCEVIIDDLCVEELWSGDKKFVIEARLMGDNSFSTEQLFSAKGTVGCVISGLSNKGLGVVQFDARRNLGIELSVYGCQGMGCVSGRRHLSTKQFNPVKHMRPCVDKSRSSDGSQKVILPKVTYTDPTISFNLRLGGARTRPHVLTMDRGVFVPAGRLPGDLARLTDRVAPWGLQATRCDEQRLQSARHSLKCQENGLAFGVEVIKHEQHNLAAVLLHHNNDGLVAAAYTIDNHQLPLPCQVLETCPLTFDVGDHAMLIRNYEEDFAVCVARWQQTCSIGSGSKLRITTYFCQTRDADVIDISADELTSLTVGDVTIDLPTGRLTVAASSDALAEHVTWALAVGTLFVTSQKTWTQHWEAAVDVGDEVGLGTESVRSGQSPALYAGSVGRKLRGPNRSHLNKKAARRRKQSASFTFLLACGLHVDLTLHATGSTSAKAIHSPISGLAVERCNGTPNNAKNIAAHADAVGDVGAKSPAMQFSEYVNEETEIIHL